MRRFAAVAVVFGLAVPHAVWAAAPTANDDPYHVTDAEKAACTEDAVRFCINTYPNEKLLLACMKRNRSSLSPVCLQAFDAGLKRRHL